MNILFKFLQNMLNLLIADIKLIISSVRILYYEPSFVSIINLIVIILITLTYPLVLVFNIMCLPFALICPNKAMLSLCKASLKIERMIGEQEMIEEDIKDIIDDKTIERDKIQYYD
jgi:hypothetical protein